MVVYNFCHSLILCSYFPVLFLYVFTLQRSLSAGFFYYTIPLVCYSPIHSAHCVCNPRNGVCVSLPHKDQRDTLYYSPILSTGYGILIVLVYNKSYCTCSLRNVPCVSTPTLVLHSSVLKYRILVPHTVANRESHFVYYFSTYSALAQQLAIVLIPSGTFLVCNSSILEYGINVTHVR